ncbi:effector-associated constant component EACC1 [Embleya sp. NPDC001921]
MRVTIRCVAEGDDDLSAELYEWLVDIPEARRHAAPEAKPGKPAPGQLGVLAVVTLVLTAGFNAGSLGVAIAAFRENRRRAGAPSITVTVEKDGKEFAVTGTDADEIRRKLDELTSA